MLTIKQKRTKNDDDRVANSRKTAWSITANQTRMINENRNNNGKQIGSKKMKTQTGKNDPLDDQAVWWLPPVRIINNIYHKRKKKKRIQFMTSWRKTWYLSNDAKNVQLNEYKPKWQSLATQPDPSTWANTSRRSFWIERWDPVHVKNDRNQIQLSN